MPRLSLQPTRVVSTFAGQDDTGLLVRFDGELAAVMVRLGSLHGEEEGFWHLEIGFGMCTGRPATFRELSAALRWIGERCLLDDAALEAEIVELARA